MSKPFQLIYSSQPFGYDQATLDGILLDARRCNKRDGITGALVCRQDVYLQLLEGPRHAVDNAYQRIRRDDRHVNVQIQMFEQVPGRLFGNWSMLHDPARSWIWTMDEIADDVLERATAIEFRHVFEILAENVQSGPKLTTVPGE